MATSVFNISGGVLQGFNPIYTGTLPTDLDLSGLNITSIAQSAFSNKGITSVIFPSSLTTIGKSAFAINNINKLVIIPKNVTSIGKNVFQNNPKLSLVTLQGNIPNFSGGPNTIFSSCSSSLNVTVIPSVNITALQTALQVPTVSYTFSLSTDRTTLNGYTLSNYASNIMDLHTQKYVLDLSILPSSVMTIAPNAFQNMPFITSVALSNSIVSIGENAFQNDSISSLSVPSFRNPGYLVHVRPIDSIV
jgi:hypothetical protein